MLAFAICAARAPRGCRASRQPPWGSVGSGTNTKANQAGPSPCGPRCLALPRRGRPVGVGPPSSRTADPRPRRAPRGASNWREHRVARPARSREFRPCDYSRGCVNLVTPAGGIMPPFGDHRAAFVARGAALKGGAMTERDFTAREDRFVGVCLAAAAIILVFIFVLSTP
jgi:hypothetical protein